MGVFNIQTGGRVIPSWQATGLLDTIKCIKAVNSTILVSGSTDNTLSVWKLSGSSASKLRTISYHSNDVNAVDQLANGYMVSGGADKAIYVWDVSNGNKIATKTSAHPQAILCLKAMSNGYFATGAASPDNKVNY